MNCKDRNRKINLLKFHCDCNMWAKRVINIMDRNCNTLQFFSWYSPIYAYVVAFFSPIFLSLSSPLNKVSFGFICERTYCDSFNIHRQHNVHQMAYLFFFSSWYICSVCWFMCDTKKSFPRIYNNCNNCKQKNLEYYFLLINDIMMTLD